MKRLWGITVIRCAWGIARVGIWLHDAGVGVLGDDGYLGLMDRCEENGARRQRGRAAAAD